MDEQTSRWKEITNNQLLCTLVGAILGFISALIIAQLPSNQLVQDGNMPSVSPLIESYFVDTGYVDKSILDLETPAEQLAAIQSALVTYECMYRDELQKAESMAAENEKLRTELEQLDHQLSVVVNDAYIKIDGELMNSGNLFHNAVAQIEGDNYYSEEFLNSFVLNNPISYLFDSNIANIGNPKVEKTKVAWDSMVFNANINKYYFLEDSQTFCMSNQVYNEGIVLSDEDYFYINLSGHYSKMTFTYGHVDGYPKRDLRLIVYALDDDGETYSTVIDTIELKGEMIPKECEIMLNYAKAIKITVSNGDAGTRFGLTDCYLYS